MATNAVQRWISGNPVLSTVVGGLALGALFGGMHGFGETSKALSQWQLMAFATGAFWWFNESLDAAYAVRWRAGASRLERLYYPFALSWFWGGLMLAFQLPNAGLAPATLVLIWLGGSVLFGTLMAWLDRGPTPEELARRSARFKAIADDRGRVWARRVMGFHIATCFGLVTWVCLDPSVWSNPAYPIWVLLFAGGLMPQGTAAPGHSMGLRICVSMGGALLLVTGYLYG